MCPLGTQPPICAQQTSPCTPNPCHNLGQCIENGTNFRCICQGSFSGTTCQNENRTCGNLINAETGTLTYPPAGIESYENNVRCAWVIKTNRSMVLNVTFTKFHLEHSTTACRFDWLQVRICGMLSIRRKY